MQMFLDDFLTRSNDLPSLPTIYFDLKEAINDPRSTTTTIGRIISNDQCLAARLMRLANSSFYGFPTSVDNIGDAITLIGLQQTRDLALATFVIDVFKGMDSELVTTNSFWKHSIGCGVCSRLLAAERREHKTEKFFLIGLLHDIGRLLMFVSQPRTSEEVLERCRETGELEYRVEREIFGCDHAEVGGRILQKWMLPRGVSEAVHCHHQPGVAQSSLIESSIVHVADVIVNALGLGTSGAAKVPPLSPDAWNRLGIKSGALPLIIEELDRQMVDVTRILTAR
jgi:HD-like signal output (HDOD) protein